LSFLTSFDEVIMALFVSGGDNSTLTRNMFNAPNAPLRARPAPSWRQG